MSFEFWKYLLAFLASAVLGCGGNLACAQIQSCDELKSYLKDISDYNEVQSESRAGLDHVHWEVFQSMIDSISQKHFALLNNPLSYAGTADVDSVSWATFSFAYSESEKSNFMDIYVEYISRKGEEYISTNYQKTSTNVALLPRDLSGHNYAFETLYKSHTWKRRFDLLSVSVLDENGEIVHFSEDKKLFKERFTKSVSHTYFIKFNLINGQLDNLVFQFPPTEKETKLRFRKLRNRVGCRSRS